MGNYSKYLEAKVKTRGSKTGFCSICNEYGPLTKDHVPPKGCGNIKNVVLETFCANSNINSRLKKNHSQSGLHYRTICSNCNNNLLGAKYDLEINALYSEVVDRAKSAHSQRITLPKNSYHFIRPQKIARAIVGHLLAANSVDQIENGKSEAPFYEALSEYFLDEDKDVPEQLEIYYWLYPFREIKVIRGASKLSLDWSSHILGDIIKFPPFGFWLVWEKPPSINIGLNRLIHRPGIGFNETTQISFDYENIQQSDFPEGPTDREATLFLDSRTSIAK